MDIYCMKQYLEDKRYIDTSRLLTKHHGERFPLSNLVKCTMNDFKLMDSADAPKLWKMGQYDEVVEYCMKDTQLVYDLWKYGQDNGIVKAFSVDKEEFVDAIGDMVVVLTNMAHLGGTTIEKCIDTAYKVISKRTGKMVNGTFVKDEK